MTENAIIPAWEAAMEKFLLKWKGKKEVTGAIVCGSRIHGTATKNSDIDLHIVLSNSTKWRERGNEYVDGFLIEYFANSIKQLARYRKDDFENYLRTEARMFGTGRIVFDRTGSLSKFAKQSKKDLLKPLKKFSKFDCEIGKYALWDGLDNLKDLWENKSLFYIQSHHLLLHKSLQIYRKYMGIEIPSDSKIERYFLDKSFGKKYQLDHFPDHIFVRYYLDATETPTYGNIDTIIRHVLEEMGGFQVDGWKIRSLS